jgi:hypothetical protein
LVNLVVSRLKSTTADLSTICSQLDWRGGTRFAQLSGVVPATENEYSAGSELNFSLLTETNVGRTTEFARLDVTRGLPTSGIRSYDEFTSKSALREPFLRG